MFPLRPKAALLCLVALPSLALLAQTQWTETPVPMGSNWTRAHLEDVAASGPQDAWAVGQFRTAIPPYLSDGHTLAMRWDGTGWTHVPTPSPSWGGRTEAILSAVDAVAADDVWAGGSRKGTAGGLSIGDWIHVQHWDGASWTEVPVPPGGGMNYSGTAIHEVLALAADDVWFGGAWATPNWQRGGVDWYPLAMHWDGSGMTVYPTPIVHDNSPGTGFASVSMSALASDDIWAACAKNSASGRTYLNVVLHWDGSSWRRVAIPDSSVEHTLHSIEAVASNDIWVFGTETFTQSAYVLHYDGTSWTEITNGPLALDSHAFGPNDIYVTGTAVSHFDGTGWTLQTIFSQPTAVTRAIVSDGYGGLWVVGAYSSSGLRPFAAHGTSPNRVLHTVANLAAGATASFTADNAGAGALVLFGVSVTGAGPVPTPFGNLALSPPIGLLPFQYADPNGTAAVGFTVPPGLTGLRVYSQAAASPGGASISFSNPLATTVQ